MELTTNFREAHLLLVDSIPEETVPTYIFFFHIYDLGPET